LFCPSWLSIFFKLKPNYIGGEGGIRTHGTFRYDSFQDCCLKPLGHLSKQKIVALD
jgi:hypothetical protein